MIRSSEPGRRQITWKMGGGELWVIDDYFHGDISTDPQE